MNSPGHRANILSAKFGKVGIGYALGGKSSGYWVQWFTN
ncbi:MAG: CAP domain-containing protein [Eubacteriales bacterium]